MGPNSLMVVYVDPLGIAKIVQSCMNAGGVFMNVRVGGGHYYRGEDITFKTYKHLNSIFGRAVCVRTYFDLSSSVLFRVRYPI